MSLVDTLDGLRDQILQGVSAIQLFKSYVSIVLDPKTFKNSSHQQALSSSSINPKLAKELQNASIDNPLNAIADIAKLTKAHTTKLAIAFKPPIAIEAASKCFNDSVGLMAPMFGALVSTTNTSPKNGQKQIPSIVVAELKKLVMEFYQANEAFYTELVGLVLAQQKEEEEGKDKSNKDADSISKSNNLRLLNAGKVWHACDALTSAPTAALSAAKLLASKVVIYSDVVSDACEELNEAAMDEFEDFDEGYDSDIDANANSNTINDNSNNSNSASSSNNSNEIVVMDGPASEPLDPQTAQAFDKMVHKKTTSAAKVDAHRKPSFSKADADCLHQSLDGLVLQAAAKAQGGDDNMDENDDDESNIALKYKAVVSKIPTYLKTNLIGVLRLVHKSEMEAEKKKAADASSSEPSTSSKSLSTSSSSSTNLAPNPYDTIYTTIKSLSSQVDDLIIAAVYDHDQDLVESAAKQVLIDLNKIQENIEIIAKQQQALPSTFSSTSECSNVVESGSTLVKKISAEIKNLTKV